METRPRTSRQEDGTPLAERGVHRTLNTDTYEALQTAGFDLKQAAVLATAIPDIEPALEQLRAELPDWSQFATKQDLAELRDELRGEMSGLESRLIRWMMGIFLAMASLLAAAVSVLVTVLG